MRLVQLAARQFVVLACMASSTGWMSAASAQAYPTKPVRYVVPVPAGGSPDTVGRVLAERLSRTWGQQVIVDNRGGAGTTLGTAFAAKAPPDGYTLFQCNVASSAIAEALYNKPGYDHQRDFVAISRIGTTPNAFVAHPSTPFRRVKDVIDYARTNPGRLSYAATTAGSSPQLSMELLKTVAKLDVVHISYKGASQAITDVIGGQVPIGLSNAPLVVGPIQSGRLRGVAVTGDKRFAQLPDVPTMQESGLPGYVVTSWYGVCTNAGTPPAILDKLHADVTSALRSPEVQKAYADLMVDVSPTSRTEFAEFLRAEAARWAQVVKAAGIPKQ